MKKEIWTYLETDGRGELLSTSKELLAKAGIIAAAAEEEKNYTVCALLAGGDHDALESAAEKALGAGAGKALLIEGAELSVYSAEFYSDAIGRLAETEKPEMILFERTTDGMDLAPRLAARLKAGMISDCVDLVKKDGKLLWIRHAFGGTAAAAVSFREEEIPHIISIRPGSFGGAGRRVNNLVDKRFFTPDVFAAGRQQTSCDPIGETRSGLSLRAAAHGSGMFGRGKEAEPAGPAQDAAKDTAKDAAKDTAKDAAKDAAKDTAKDAAKDAPGKADAITHVAYSPADSGSQASQAAGKKIVRPELLEILEAAADQGMDPAGANVIVAGGNGAGPEGFKLIEELAELLHGAVGASRVAVDKGWISHSHLIGQSGITVTPDLYINCGISGSVQHIVGMRDSKCVVSINKDPKALIFNVSDYGIVGDLHKVLPALIAEIRRHKG